MTTGAAFPPLPFYPAFGEAQTCTRRQRFPGISYTPAILRGSKSGRGYTAVGNDLRNKEIHDG